MDTLIGAIQPMDPKNSLLGRLLDFAIGRGINVEPARAMHRLIDFSDPPLGYFGRLRTIRRVLELDIGTRTLAYGKPELTAWIPYIDAILPAGEEAADALGLSGTDRKRFLAEEKKDPLFRRGWKRHGLESLLWMNDPNALSARSERLLCLMGQMIVAQAAVLTNEYTNAEAGGKPRPDEDLFSSLYQPCMLARKFARSNWEEARSCLPLSWDAAAYADALDGLRATPPQNINGVLDEVDADVLDKAWGGISSFIRRGISPTEYHKREFKGRQPAASGIRRAPAIPDDSSETGSHHHQEDVEFTRIAISAGRRKELDANGECPEDHVAVRTFILTAGGGMAAAHVLAAKARENQLLPRRYREPQPHEFVRVIDAMRILPEPFGTLRERKELIAWTEFVFFQSCSPEQATGCRVGFPETPLEDCDFMLRMAEDPADDHLFPPRIRVRAVEPPYQTEYFPIAGERARSSYFEIPDIAGVCVAMRELLRDLQAAGDRPDVRPDSIRHQAVKIFSGAADTYASFLDRVSAAVGLGDRVTASGLRNVLFQRYAEKGDFVSAALLTCSEPSVASVRRWYFTPEVEHLRSIHRLGTESVLAEFPRQWRPERRRPALDASTEFIGSRRCAEVDFVKGQVGVLRSIVETAYPVRSIQQRLAAFAKRHNALTMLAVWAIDLSVGMRSTEHPYFHPSEYDRETGMGSFREKGKFRPYCLTQLAMEIAEEFDRYMRRLRVHGLPQSTPQLPCYFVDISDGGLVAVPVRPKTIEDYLGTTFQFPPNWGRRIVRTLAVERGLPSVYADAYCGHSNYGQEPYYPFSSFEPLLYFQSMREFIGQFLGDLGFTPLTFDFGFLEPGK